MNSIARRFVWIDDPAYEVYQITSNHFCAGITLHDNIVCEAAPILDYMRIQRWNISQVKHYCSRKNWKVEQIR